MNYIIFYYGERNKGKNNTIITISLFKYGSQIKMLLKKYDEGIERRLCMFIKKPSIYYTPLLNIFKTGNYDSYIIIIIRQPVSI